mgnify:CR=1 FL=1
MNEDSRTPEQLRRHFEVEHELAGRLLRSTREERARLYQTLYDELFARVPDHPRRVRRESEESIRRALAARLALLRPFLSGVDVFLEIAPGDCTLAFEVCRHARQVLAADISDQTGGRATVPANFKLVVYDGYRLDLPEASVDLAFSYQFLEHLHPEDMEGHLALICRLLKPGGAYVFSTPHRFSGPHDISRHFSDEPAGFHLKEWTYGELFALLRQTGFASAYTYRFGQPRRQAAWNAAVLGVERILGWLPRNLQRAASGRLFQSVTAVAFK